MGTITRAVLTVAALTLIGCGDSGPDGPQGAMVKAPADDPRLAATIREAQDRWPEFEQAFREQRENWAYAVKLPFDTAEGRVEFLWIQVESINGREITGRIDNVPMADIGHSLGDSVTRSVDDVQDWIYANGPEEMYGGFSIPVLAEIEAERG